MEHISVFYSWQSDLDKNANHFFIRDALRAVIESLKGDPDTDLTLRTPSLDSDTQNVPGSPDISQTVFAKIDKCNIFVGDISIINSNDTQHKKTPNPNVLLELGYAVHRLGWERIICVFNETSGKLPDDLPFDLRTRRISRYKFSGSAVEKKSVRQDLEVTLRKAIKQILKSNLPAPLTSLSDKEVIARQRDLGTLQAFFERINTYVLDLFFSAGRQGFMPDQVLFYEENLRGFIASTNFHIYNPVLLQKITDFSLSWDKSLGFGTHFFSTRDFRATRFVVNDDESAQAFEVYLDAINSTESAFRDLIQYVKDTYIEIDFDQTNATAAKVYQEEMKEVREMLGRKDVKDNRN